jgi:hypothetical protein
MFGVPKTLVEMGAKSTFLASNLIGMESIPRKVRLSRNRADELEVIIT